MNKLIGIKYLTMFGIVKKAENWPYRSLLKKKINYMILIILIILISIWKPSNGLKLKKLLMKKNSGTRLRSLLIIWVVRKWLKNRQWLARIIYKNRKRNFMTVLERNWIWNIKENLNRNRLMWTILIRGKLYSWKKTFILSFNEINKNKYFVAF